MLIASLALRNLFRDRFFLLCNIAVMVGILVPLLVLVGVKNGVYSALIGEMQRDPASLQIDTSGNVTLSEAEIAPLRDWPEVAFLTPKVRSQFDYVNVRAAGGRTIRPALLVPSGKGDPVLAGGALDGLQVAVSAILAGVLELAEGDQLQLITQAEDRPRQLVLDVELVKVLPEHAVAGRAVLAPFALLDLVEAFYDAYSLPDYGIQGSRDLAERAPAYAGVRLFARELKDVAPLQSRVEAVLGVAATSQARDVEALLGLGRKLDLALGFTAALAAIGLGAALSLGFWSDVMRKRMVLACIALVGVPGRKLAFFPVVQALVTATAGLVVSFGLYLLAGRAAARLFGDGLPDGAPLTVIPPGQGALICLCVLALALGSAMLAAWRALHLDPASVLREVT
ncbi:ABC transporter permease [Primorskyibacter sp. S87]|uniref:ABC transporter permease n=1 Tax=Primorskyibacter sp. S87 TaxID=3415126 RepID=UPI003C7E143C